MTNRKTFNYFHKTASWRIKGNDSSSSVTVSGLTHLCLARGWRCSCHSQWRWCHESPSSSSPRSEFAPRPSTGSDSAGSVSTGWNICSWSCGLILYSSWTLDLREVTAIRKQLSSTKAACMYWLSEVQFNKRSVSCFATLSAVKLIAKNLYLKRKTHSCLDVCLTCQSKALNSG